MKEMGPFRHQGNEMNEQFSFKLGVRFVASVDMGVLYKKMYKNSGTELQSI